LGQRPGYIACTTGGWVIAGIADVERVLIARYGFI